MARLKKKSYKKHLMKAGSRRHSKLKRNKKRQRTSKTLKRIQKKKTRRKTHRGGNACDRMFPIATQKKLAKLTFDKDQLTIEDRNTQDQTHYPYSSLTYTDLTMGRFQLHSDDLVIPIRVRTTDVELFLHCLNAKISPSEQGTSIVPIRADTPPPPKIRCSDLQLILKKQPEQKMLGLARSQIRTFRLVPDRGIVYKDGDVIKGNILFEDMDTDTPCEAYPHGLTIYTDARNYELSNECQGCTKDFNTLQHFCKCVQGLVKLMKLHTLHHTLKTRLHHFNEKLNTHTLKKASLQKKEQDYLKKAKEMKHKDKKIAISYLKLCKKTQKSIEQNDNLLLKLQNHRDTSETTHQRVQKTIQQLRNTFH